MLIDNFLPTYEASERHQISIAAPPHRVYRAIKTADLGGHPVIKTLMGLRALPGWFATPRAARARAQQSRETSRVTLDVMLRRGFVQLAEEPDRELVLGIVGRFWRPSGNIDVTDAVRFREPLGPGRAQAVWNFTLTPAGEQRTLLTTETRIHCADAAALRSFRRYWFVIRPFSGLIRRVMLSSIARSCSGAG